MDLFSLHKIMQHFKRNIDISDLQLTYVQAITILLVSENETTVSNLVDTLMYDSGYMTRVVDDLCKKKILIKKSDKKDKRLKRLYLSNLGSILSKEIQREFEVAKLYKIGE